MHRAHKFIEESREEILGLMAKGLKSMHPKELDLLIALCDAHEGVCEFIELGEKFSKGDGYWHSAGRIR